MPSPKALLFALLVLAGPAAFAADAPPAAADPALEQRVTRLGEELRCLVCQNQTISDSHADLAVDLKNQIREKLQAGASDEEVKEYMVERYGDFVLYRPPVKATTWVLWFGPFLLLLTGVAVLFVKLRSRARRVAATADISEADSKRARALLADGGEQQ
ncbi:MAG: cytochrome c-type biogenesis protein [Rhodocyclaceae bacterium]